VSNQFVLCVDDDRASLTVRAVLLSKLGYRVITADSGMDAVEIFRCNSVGLVVLDQLLGDALGTEVACMMKEMRPEVPIILLTGLLDPPQANSGADVILTKGIHPDAFLDQVRSLMPNNAIGD
jgi:DNA-binding response OmpR family regulator